jgi:hypothetical protein
LAADEAAVREKEERAVEGWRGSEENGNRGMAGFLQFLDQIFFMLRPWNPPLFIGGGWGWFCLHRGKIWALNSVGKDPNR